MRTMASDVEKMGQSGGFISRAEMAPIPAPKINAAPAEEAKPKAPILDEKKKSILYIILVVVGAAGALFLVGFIGYPYLSGLFGGGKAPQAPAAPHQSLPAPVVNNPAPPAVIPSVTHQTYFITSLPVVKLQLNLASGGVAQSLQLAAKGVLSTTTLFEVQWQKPDGSSFAWSDFLPAFASGLDTNFFMSNFSPDFTAFVYKDKAGLWPGYVMKLTSSRSTLLLANDLLKLESLPSSLTGFFASPPGSPVANFKDGQVVGEPVRYIAFEKTPAEFVYGWFHGYLVFGTSEAAITAAVKNL